MVLQLDKSAKLPAGSAAQSADFSVTPERSKALIEFIVKNSTALENWTETNPENLALRPNASEKSRLTNEMKKALDLPPETELNIGSSSSRAGFTVGAHFTHNSRAQQIIVDVGTNKLVREIRHGDEDVVNTRYTPEEKRAIRFGNAMKTALESRDPLASLDTMAELVKVELNLPRSLSLESSIKRRNGATEISLDHEGKIVFQAALALDDKAVRQNPVATNIKTDDSLALKGAQRVNDQAFDLRVTNLPADYFKTRSTLLDYGVVPGNKDEGLKFVSGDKTYTIKPEGVDHIDLAKDGTDLVFQVFRTAAPNQTPALGETIRVNPNRNFAISAVGE